MKIVCFHLLNDYSGSPRVLKNILSDFVERGIKVDLITSKGGILDELPRCDNIKRKYYRYKFSENRVATTLRYLRVQIYTFFIALGYLFDKKAVFYINTILPAGAAIAGRIMGKRIICHYHENARTKSGFYRFLAWVMQKTASEIICVSEYQRSFLKRRNNVHIVPNALDKEFAERLRPCPEKAFERKKVLMPTSLKKYKGTVEFTRLAEMLPQFSFELVINDTQENIDAFLKENNIKPYTNLVIHPRQSDMVTFYNNASLVLNLSNKELCVETFGMTALEAMAAGLPVIVPEVGGIAEMVTDGENGFKINMQFLTKISLFIEKILSDKKLYLHLSHGALAYSQNNSVRKSAERIMEIMEHCDKTNQ